MRKYTYDYLIVGSGLFGSTFAQIMNGNGKKCLVIDKRGHTGGNIYTKEENDIKIHWYGAHIFHTDNEEVWRFLKYRLSDCWIVYSLYVARICSS